MFRRSSGGCKIPYGGIKKGRPFCEAVLWRKGSYGAQGHQLTFNLHLSVMVVPRELDTLQRYR